MADNNDSPEIYDDLNPYVRLSVDQTGSEPIYHLQVMFRDEGVLIAESTGLQRMSDDLDPMTAEYYIQFTLEAADSGGNAPITTVELRNPTGKGRILVLGRKIVHTDSLIVNYGPKGDGKTIIRFEDAVLR